MEGSRPRRPGLVRVLRVLKGRVRPGQLLSLRSVDFSLCGAGDFERGSRGLILLDSLRGRLVFQGYLPADYLARLDRLGLEAQSLARMRMLAIALAAARRAAAAASFRRVVSIGAPDPPPANAAERRALRQRMAEHRRRYTRQVIDAYRAAAALVEVVDPRGAGLAPSDPLRVDRRLQGRFQPRRRNPSTQGTPAVAAACSASRSMCGMRALMELRPIGSPPVNQYVFLPQNEIRMLRENRVLPRPRR